jgi:response regulator RpfG family c-di-GMP phosphodiesterase
VLLTKGRKNMQNDILLFSEEDELLFADESSSDLELSESKWKVLIVDDESEIHNVTKLVLSDFQFDGKGLEFLSTYTAEETKKVLAENTDIAVVLLDVVMEEEDSGLKLVKHIRQELKNDLIRIVLRTGQPGQAPEKKVIVDYDINDYKEKTELTAQKLFTCMITSIRSYRDITTIFNNKRGLEKIIESSTSIFEVQSMKKFASGVLIQLTSILNLNKNAIYCQTSSFAATRGEDGFHIMAATGDYSEGIDRHIKDVVPNKVLKYLERASKEKKSTYGDNYIIMYFRSEIGSENMIYLERTKKLSDIDVNFIEIFCNNVSIAFENIYLNKEVENTQKEVIFTLGEIAEARSKETGNHVRRVAEYSKLLALKYGLSEDEAELIKMASPMHDIGKLAVPDEILNKPGKLTYEEFEIIKNHSVTGYEMLKNSSKVIMKTASIIANEHHEKYNGKGYPQGLRGEEIHIYGRITAVADVFDALCSERVYKKAWPLEQVVELFKNEIAQQFDPDLVDILLNNIKDFTNIKETFKDA